MPNLLKQLELEELSLVDRPANKQAMVSLLKRDNSNGEPMEQEINKMSHDMKEKLKPYMDKGMTEEEAKKAYEEDMRKADDATAEEIEVERLKAENQFLRKSLIENGFIIRADSVEKKAEPEYMEYEGEKINKADIPTPILKALEAAEIAKVDAELTETAKESLPNFDVNVAKTLVKSFIKDEAVMEALKGADAFFAGSMEELGKSDASGEFAKASDKLDALVKSYMDDNKMKKSQYAIAYAEVAKTDEGRALINKSYKGD